MITRRPVTVPADLRLAESVVTGAWLDGAPFAASHAGDLDWWFASVAPDSLEAHLRLWSVQDTVRAWSWIHGHLVHWEIRPSDPETDGRLLDAILRAAIAETGDRLEAWVAEDDATTLATLDGLGFRPQELRLSQFQRRVDGDAPIPEFPLPADYRLRHVRGPSEIAARAAIHRVAFPTATQTPEHFARLSSAPHYRVEDDLVVEAPDGSLAAFAMAWWDPTAHVGEFEPVGTHPAHRRLGLGRALLVHGLRRYQQLGAGLVQVYAMSDNPAAERLYQAVGFARRRYRRRFIRVTQAGGSSSSMVASDGSVVA